MLPEGGRVLTTVVADRSSPSALNWRTAATGNRLPSTVTVAAWGCAMAGGSSYPEAGLPRRKGNSRRRIGLVPAGCPFRP